MILKSLISTKILDIALDKLFSNFQKNLLNRGQLVPGKTYNRLKFRIGPKFRIASSNDIEFDNCYILGIYRQGVGRGKAMVAFEGSFIDLDGQIHHKNTYRAELSGLISF